MKDRLPCELIQDLMPSYIDGLTSRKTNEIVEEHLAQCDVCTAVLNDMKMPEPEVEITEKQDIDYLKKNRNRMHRLVILAGVIAAAVVFLLAFYFIFIQGRPVNNADLVEAKVTVEGNDITVEGNLKDEHRGVSDVTFYSEDGTLYVDVIETAKSSFHPNQFSASYEWMEDWPFDLTTIYVCGRVVWDQGSDISEETAKAYEAKNRYVGDFPRDGQVAAALEMEKDIRVSKNELQTNEMPYGWTMILEDGLVTGQNYSEMEEKMQAYAGGLIALIDNLGYVTYEYEMEDQSCTLTINEQDADTLAGASVKELAETPKGLQLLMNILGL